MASWQVPFLLVPGRVNYIHQFLKVYLPSSSFNGMNHATWLIDALQWWTITPLPVTNGSCACHCDSQCNIISCSSLVGDSLGFWRRSFGALVPNGQQWLNEQQPEFFHENQGTLGTVHQIILIVAGSNSKSLSSKCPHFHQASNTMIRGKCLILVIGKDHISHSFAPVTPGIYYLLVAYYPATCYFNRNLP